MQITIITIGSRGDVQPYLALALGLQAAGHHVALVTHAAHADFVKARSVPFKPLAGDPRILVEGLVLDRGMTAVQTMRVLRAFFLPMFDQMAQDIWRACQGSDAVISSLFALFGYHIAEKLGLPWFWALLYPSYRTRALPAILTAPALPLGGSYNLATHWLQEQAIWQTFRSLTNTWRQESLGLPPLSAAWPYYRRGGQPVPVLCGYSPLVVTPPPDWPPQVHTTGYWFLNGQPGWQPPAALVDFLAAGPPPVYIGFGSMIGADAEALADTALAALARTGRRGLLLTGWGGIARRSVPDTVFVIDSAPHDWLFPQVAAVVHHGGAGTTAAGLRAGVPSIVVPFLGDQPFWGRRVQELGVGPPPVPHRQLTPAHLAQSIELACDRRVRARAALLGQRLRAEDGVGHAVRVFEAEVRRSAQR